MANLVNLEAVSKSYGVRPLLDEGTLGAAEVVDALTALGIEARQVVLPELDGCKGTDIGDLSAAGWTRRDIFNLFKR